MKRSYSIDFLFGLAGAGLWLLAAAAARAAEEPRKPAAPWTFVDPTSPRERTLEFPTDFAAGNLFLRHWQSGDWNEWKPFAAARGQVKIPREQVVRLDVSPRAATILNVLEPLPPDAIHTLNLGKSAVTDADLASIAHLTGLRILNLRGTKIGDEGMAHLEGLTGIETLYLDNTRVSDLGMSALRGMSGLVHLDLSKTSANPGAGAITDDGLKNLKDLKKLQFISLHGSAVTAEGMRNLTASRNLYHLNASHSKVDDRLGELIEQWPLLIELHMQGTGITNAGLEKISKLRYVKVLDLTGSKIKAGAVGIFGDKPKLESLALAYTVELTADDIEKLGAMPHLKRLILSPGQIDKAGLDRLKALKPELDIKALGMKAPAKPK